MLSEQHKDAMRKGRKMGSIVDAYLKALDQPPRPSVADIDALTTKKLALEAEAENLAGTARLKTFQLIIELERRIADARLSTGMRVDDVEGDFVRVAKEYSEAKSISYAAWRKCGVPARVLKASGIRQTRNRLPKA